MLCCHSACLRRLRWRYANCFLLMCDMFRLASIDLSCQSHLFRHVVLRFPLIRPLLRRDPFCVVVLCPGVLMAVVEVVCLGPMEAGAGWFGLFVVLGLGLLVAGAVYRSSRCLAV